MAFIEGYFNTLSATPGETVHLSASSNSDNCWVEVIREGFQEDRVIQREAINVGQHPVPDQAWEHGCGLAGVLGVHHSQRLAERGISMPASCARGSRAAKP